MDRPSEPIPGGQRALLFSDVHLSEDVPRTVESFFRFVSILEQEKLDSIFVLGDLFEYWAGDDDLLEPLNRRVVAALRHLSEKGMRLYFLTGNRDLLLGEGFARSSTMSILNDPVEIEVAGRRLLISHGDTLCTDDLEYQAYRSSVRSRAWQDAFLAKPLVERKEVIASLRLASETAKATKSEAIMDVSPNAVAQLFRQTGATVLIHGHTHRPGRQETEVDGILRQRWVLPDWDGEVSPARGGALVCDVNGLEWMDLAP